MSRCAMLSAGGDVLLADFVLNLWNKHWRDEIDTFYVGYNNNAGVPLETSYEFLKKWEKNPKVRIIYTPHGVGNGVPITQMMLNSKEDLVLLIEDDGFIFTPGVVSGWFEKIESGEYDVVGSPRYSVGEVAEAAKLKYNLDYSGIGDKGFGWWPNFFVCKREDLLKTDWRFASDKYPKGEYIKELDHVMENDDYTDTFTFACLQLRAMGVREFQIPQNHAHPFDLQNVTNHEVMFSNGNPLYIHGGSLSSGWGGYLNVKLPPVDTDMEKQDVETRVAMWRIVEAMTEGYYEFRKEYIRGIIRLEDECNLDRERIDKKVELYMKLMHL